MGSFTTVHVWVIHRGELKFGGVQGSDNSAVVAKDYVAWKQSKDKYEQVLNLQKSYSSSRKALPRLHQLQFTTVEDLLPCAQILTRI